MVAPSFGAGCTCNLPGGRARTRKRKRWNVWLDACRRKREKNPCLDHVTYRTQYNRERERAVVKKADTMETGWTEKTKHMEVTR